jgi:hypothetical protein
MIKTQFTHGQYLRVRSLIAENFGREEWDRSSKKRRIRIVNRAFEAFRASPWWARLLQEVPPVDGYWKPLLAVPDDERMLAELAARCQSETPEEKLDLTEAMYRLMRRWNGMDSNTLD